MRVELIAITRTMPNGWTLDMRQGWSAIHHIQTPELKDTDTCYDAEDIAYELDKEIDTFWQMMDGGVVMRLYVQCNPAIFSFLARWRDKITFVYPIFNKDIFRGWRLCEKPEGMWKKLITFKLKPNQKHINPFTVSL